MLRKKENRKYIIIISILSILLLISFIFVIILGRYYYKNITKPQYGLGIPNNSNSCSSEDIEKIDIVYIMDKKKIVEFDKYGEEYLDKYQGRKYISYPVLLGEHNSVIDLNDKIKDKVDTYINNFYLDGEVIDETIESDELCFVKVLDGTQKNYCNYLTLKYDVYENDRYISIVEDEILESENASGDISLNDIYIVDKTTGMVVSNDEVIKNMNNLSLMKNNLIKYVKENYTSFSYYDVWEVELNDFIADLDILLSTNSFKVFFENESVYFYFNKIQGVEDVVFKYTNDVWEEYCDMYNF